MVLNASSFFTVATGLEKGTEIELIEWDCTQGPSFQKVYCKTNLKKLEIYNKLQGD